MGTTNPFSSLFGKSPFKPLQQHMRIAIQCASEIPGLFDALVKQDQGKLKGIQEKISDLESQADTLRNEVLARLPKSLLMPVDRRDMVDLIDLQDGIADTAQDIAGLLIVREMEVPVGMGEPLITLARRSVDACNKAAEVIEALDELVEMGFGGRESTRVMELIETLDKIEHDTDEQAMALFRSLFTNEDQLKPVSVMLWYQLIGWIGNLADSAEMVGDRLRLMIAR